MEAPFLEGVSYYSRQEEAESRRIALERQDKAAVADIQIRSDDTEALDFLQRVRTEIDTWKHRPTVRFHVLFSQVTIAKTVRSRNLIT